MATKKRMISIDEAMRISTKMLVKYDKAMKAVNQKKKERLLEEKEQRIMNLLEEKEQRIMDLLADVAKALEDVSKERRKTLAKHDVLLLEIEKVENLNVKLDALYDTIGRILNLQQEEVSLLRKSVSLLEAFSKRTPKSPKYVG